MAGIFGCTAEQTLISTGVALTSIIELALLAHVQRSYPLLLQQKQPAGGHCKCFTARLVNFHIGIDIVCGESIIR
jgi:hypothetical protein